MLISNIALAFSNFSLKTLKKGPFGLNLRIFIFAQSLHFDKFKGADFKYGNGFLIVDLMKAMSVPN